MQASAAWLSARGLRVPPSTAWEVSIGLSTQERSADRHVDSSETNLQIAIDATEWGVFFSHAGELSWIRVIDVPIVHEHDDFNLWANLPPLRAIDSLVQQLEETYRIRFRRQDASIRTTIADAEPKILAWVIASL